MTNAAKNIVLFFDHDRADSDAAPTNVRALFELVDDDGDSQLTWYHSGVVGNDERRAFRRGYRGPRTNLVDAYLFLVERWEPGDQIFVFGGGPGAFCARALVRLLNTAGVLDQECDEVVQYVLANWVLPHTHRSPADWDRLAALTSQLMGGHEVSVPVQFLGLFDTVTLPGLPRTSGQGQDTDLMTNVEAGRHAVAIDERRLPAHEHLLSADAADRVQEVWFRGTHADVTGSAGCHRALAEVTLDWVLDGARRAGLRVDEAATAPAPTDLSCADERRMPAALLARVGRWGVGLRELPQNARVHASVEAHLRGRPDYWYRLPDRVQWADTGWPARSERLMAASTSPLATSAPHVLTAAS